MEKIESYLYHSKNEDAKKHSASGAAFYEIANKALKEGYYIAGCVWEEGLVAKHIVSNKYEDLKRMQGSKYVQSDVADCYKKILELLNSGKKVLFSGTQCQAVAIGNIVKLINKQDSLISVAVICHGVPSPKAWSSYKKWEEEKNKSELIDVNFKNKEKNGYKTTYTKYTFKSGNTKYCPTYLPVNKYVEAGIVYNLSLRPSCIECKAKGYNEAIDIVLGDWHSECIGDGALGTSCITCFTDKGIKKINEYLEGLRIIEYDCVVSENGCIEKNSWGNKNRNKFFEMISDYRNWDKVEKLYPPKYIIKKILCYTGLYEIIKRKH